MTRTNGPEVPVLPRYLQVQQFLRELIDGAAFAPGDKVPSERELAEQLGVSRMTVRKAMENLVQEGVLERDSTSGTRVRVPKVSRVLNDPSVHSITQMVAAAGGQSGGRLLDFQVLPAPSSVSEKLAVSVGSAVVMLRRVRLVNDVAFCLETSYLPAARVPDLVAEDLAGNQSLYAVLHDRYGVVPGAGESTISVSSATEFEGRVLSVPVASPVLLYRSRVRDERGVPFEYLKSVNHPQLVAFRVAEGGVTPRR